MVKSEDTWTSTLSPGTNKHSTSQTPKTHPTFPRDLGIYFMGHIPIIWDSDSYLGFENTSRQKCPLKS